MRYEFKFIGLGRKVYAERAGGVISFYTEGIKGAGEDGRILLGTYDLEAKAYSRHVGESLLECFYEAGTAEEICGFLSAVL